MSPGRVAPPGGPLGLQGPGAIRIMARIAAGPTRDRAAAPARPLEP
jgi:hypothetical protein